MGERGFLKFREWALGMRESSNKINRKLNSPHFSSHVSHQCLPGREQRGAYTLALKPPQLIDKHKGSHFFSGSTHLFSPAEVNAASWWPSQTPSVPKCVSLSLHLQFSLWLPAHRQERGSWEGVTWAVLEFRLWPNEVDGVYQPQRSSAETKDVLEVRLMSCCYHDAFLHVHVQKLIKHLLSSFQTHLNNSIKYAIKHRQRFLIYVETLNFTGTTFVTLF